MIEEFKKTDVNIRTFVDTYVGGRKRFFNSIDWKILQPDTINGVAKAFDLSVMKEVDIDPNEHVYSLGIMHVRIEKDTSIYNDPDLLIDEVSWMSVAQLGHTISYIIRTSPKEITIGKEICPAADILKACIVCSMNSGSTWYKGRGCISNMVTICECILQTAMRYSSLETTDDILRLLVYILMLTKNWYPRKSHINHIMRMALYAYETENYYRFKASIEMIENWNYFEDIIKHFEYDMTLYDHSYEVKRSKHVNDSIPLYYTLFDTSILYYHAFEPDLNFAEILEEVLSKNTIHCRREGVSHPNQLYCNAQKRYWKSCSASTIDICVLRKTKKVSFVIDHAWFSSMVGVLKNVIDGIYLLACLNMSDIREDCIIIRDEKSSLKGELTDEIKEKCSKKVHKELRTEGLKLRHVPDSLSIFRNHSIKLVDDAIHLIGEDGTVEMEDTPTYSKDIKLYKHFDIKDPVIASAQVKGRYMHEHADKLFKEHLETMANTSIRRLRYYLSNYNNFIDMEQITTDGVGKTMMVYPEDIEVFETMCLLCVLYPISLERDGLRFYVKEGICIWRLVGHLKPKFKPYLQWSIKEPKKDLPELWTHQISAVEKLKNSEMDADLVWYDVGSGKTRIACEYIRYMIESEQMPKYCIFTTPSSAVPRICKEMKLNGLPYQEMDFATSSKNTIFMKGVVNIVKNSDLIKILKNNDHLEELKRIIPYTLLIVDEMHEFLLTKAKKSVIMMELSTTCYHAIYMTGTIITNQVVAGIISKFLQRAVPYYINSHNIMCAFTYSISARIKTNVIVVRDAIEIPLTPEQVVMDTEKPLSGSKEAMLVGIAKKAREYMRRDKGVFIVVETKDDQAFIYQLLSQKFRVEQISIGVGAKSYGVDLSGDKPGFIFNPKLPQAVITTKQHVAGYNMNLYGVCIMATMSSNQAVREQAEGRITRIDNNIMTVFVHIIYAGGYLLMFNNHESIRNRSLTVKDIQKLCKVNSSLAEMLSASSIPNGYVDLLNLLYKYGAKNDEDSMYDTLDMIRDLTWLNNNCENILRESVDVMYIDGEDPDKIKKIETFNNIRKIL